MGREYSLINKSILILLLLFIVGISTVCAAIEQDHVIINSKDWRDVYSSMVYANLDGKKANFIMSQNYASGILNMVPKGSTVLAISSRTQPYVKGYTSIMDSAGYSGDEIVVTNANFELAQLLDSQIVNFIIIDDTYGYNAISAASYAAVSKSYVLFVNDVNIDDIVDYLNGRDVNKVIIFGQVDRNAKDSLLQFNPEIINVGDRFDNNLKLVDKYLEMKPSEQVIMTNGEFIEESIMNGDNPVIFIGRNNVPDAVQNYVKTSDFQVAVLIGNELVGTATFIKRQLGISVFVKFAQGARNPAGSIATVEDLDRFPMPSYTVLLSILDIRYNTATKMLEVTYQNDENLALYFKSTITVKFDGQEIVVGDETPIFLDGNEIKTVSYPLEFGAVPANATASIYSLFGEAPKSMEFAYQADVDIGFVNILDDTEIDIESVVYNKGKQRYEIELRNLKDIDTYARAEIIDLLVNGEYKSYGSDGAVHLDPLGGKKIYVKTADFEEIDFENNPLVNVRVYYGQREKSLIKVIAGEYEFILAKGDMLIYGAIIIIVIILLLLFLLGKKCQKCRHNNPPFAKKCKKCGEKLD